MFHIHDNDKQNQRKHRKMVRRYEKGTINKNCRFYKSGQKRYLWD